MRSPLQAVLSVVMIDGEAKKLFENDGIISLYECDDVIILNAY